MLHNYIFQEPGIPVRILLGSCEVLLQRAAAAVALRRQRQKLPNAADGGSVGSASFAAASCCRNPGDVGSWATTDIPVYCFTVSS